VSHEFGQAYADAYDLLYQDKDYKAECGLIERILKEYSQGPAQTILDLGCGTGNHALLLAQHGYAIVGVDASPGMVAHARRKAAILEDGCSVEFHERDIRLVELGRKFDVALMMFAVLGYQMENTDVLSALRTARRHLRPGGLLVFDVWYGPAVLYQRPSDRVKVLPVAGGRVLRFASSELDTRRHVCTVRFHMWRLEGERLVADIEEAHQMRYFFLRELELFLECTGFSLVRLGAFPDFYKDPDDVSWNALGVARAVNAR